MTRARRCRTSPSCRRGRRRPFSIRRPIGEEEAETAERPRLIVVARPQGATAELEFVATTRQENLEDQLAFLTGEAPIPTVDDLSLRLLRHHASAVRHQKFHGVDIVMVQVEGSA